MLRSSLTKLFITRTLTASASRPTQRSQPVKVAVQPASMHETPIPSLDTTDEVYAPKLVKIVDEISELTILEVSELNKLLKKTLNISDMPMMTGVSVSATDSSTSEDDAPVTKEQTEFTVRLNAFAADSKIKVIKAVKGLMPDMNLVKAKGFVESLPQIVKKDVPKEEADEALKVLSEAGGTAVVD